MDDVQGQSKAKREAAERARWIAERLLNETDRARIETFAAELEAQADALERGEPIAAQLPSRVTIMQMQVQQGPPSDKDEDPK